MKTFFVVLLIIGAGIFVLSFISHLIFLKKKPKIIPLVYTFLEDEWLAGRDLRLKLAEAGFPLSYGSFYILMGELVKTGSVLAEDKPSYIDGHKLQTRWYRLPHK